MNKETTVGYIDLTDKELNNLRFIEVTNNKGITTRQSNKSKRFIKKFINKTNKAKLYKITIKEIKK